MQLLAAASSPDRMRVVSRAAPAPEPAAPAPACLQGCQSAFLLRRCRTTMGAACGGCWQTCRLTTRPCDSSASSGSRSRTSKECWLAGCWLRS